MGEARQRPDNAVEGDTSCENCRTLWPADALDPSTGFCPDCIHAYERDRV